MHLLTIHRGLRLLLAVVVGSVGTLAVGIGSAGPVVGADPPTQVVVFDRLTGTASVASHDATGAPGSLSSSRPSISGDGSFVAFESQATLVPGDTNAKADIYLWSRGSDQAQPISLGPGAVQANGSSHTPSISGDGSVVAFASTATNLTGVAGLSGSVGQIFAWQRVSGSVTLVSIAGTRAGSGTSRAPSVSQDGRIVAFDSDAPDLVKGDTNRVADVFLRNLVKGVTIRASLDGKGRQVAGASRRPSVSADGRAVAFDSISSALVPKDTNKLRDVFVRDLPPAIQVTPNPLDFGTVPLGTPATRAVQLLSVGWAPVAMSATAVGGPNAGDFTVAGDGCSGLTLDYGDACTISVLDVPLAPGPQTASLAITDSAPDSPQPVALIGGGGTLTVIVIPAIGPPGIVTTATGVGFPPGALVTVRWDHGITAPMSPVTVGPDGTFSVQVLVFRNDVTGPRQLLVTPAAGGPSFPDQMAQFLVVQGSLQPLGSSAIRYAATEVQLILVGR